MNESEGRKCRSNAIAEAYAQGHAKGFDDEAASNPCDGTDCDCNAVCSPYCSGADGECGEDG